MPDESLQEAIKEAYGSASIEPVLDTLEVKHETLTDVVRLVRARKDYDLRLEDDTTKTFHACGFRFTLPASGSNGIQSINVAIDNVNRAMTDFLNAVKDHNDPIILVYRPYLESDLNTPQMNPPLELTLTDIVVTAFEVAGSARFADVVNGRFLSERYTRDRFRALGI